jgi:hypothetical protein
MMRYLLPLLLILVFLIPLTQSAHAQQSVSNKISPTIHNFTSGAINALNSTGEKIESFIHNSTSESNQTVKNVGQGASNATTQIGHSLNKTATSSY